MEISKPYYDKHKNMGLVIKHWKSIDKNISGELFKVIEKIFAHNWGYNKISKEYFFNLFSLKNNVRPKMFPLFSEFATCADTPDVYHGWTFYIGDKKEFMPDFNSMD